MKIKKFIDRLKQGENLEFPETIALIDEFYSYYPCRFQNGLDNDILINEAGQNEGSCKVFSFAMAQELNQQDTLHLFGEYYQQVLDTPYGQDHQNIRHFMKYGWDGITFDDEALTVK